MKIRNDLVGVVLIASPDSGTPTMLKAGDDVPVGVTVGDHLIDPDSVTAEPTEPDAGEGQGEDTDGKDDGENAGEGEGDTPPADKPEPKPAAKRR